MNRESAFNDVRNMEGSRSGETPVRVRDEDGKAGVGTRRIRERERGAKEGAQRRYQAFGNAHPHGRRSVILLGKYHIGHQ
ncbi:hypothetical protein BDZ45DRAFT_370796 [Acephala macrosclerotiorum]|nr:hypothetical protein BDZ45DRAFT_370796 [Acephala macrosclerotiorum]